MLTPVAAPDLLDLPGDEGRRPALHNLFVAAGGNHRDAAVLSGVPSAAEVELTSERGSGGHTLYLHVGPG